MSAKVAAQAASTNQAAYDRDVVAWAMEQARLIREGRFDEIDVENVAEEIECVGRSERAALRSRIGTLIEHLLKLEASPALEPRAGWRRTVRRSRIEIERLVEDSPSLRRELSSLLVEEHDRAGRVAAGDLEDVGESAAAIHERLRAGGYSQDQAFGTWLPADD